MKALLGKIARIAILYSSHFFGFAPSNKQNFKTDFGKLKNAILFLAHSDVLHAAGGVEKVILMELEENYAGANLPYVILFAKREGQRFFYQATRRFGVIVNGAVVEDITASDLLTFIDQLDIAEVRAHHLFGWPLKILLQVFATLRAKNVKISFYVHDFLYRCPMINSVCINGDRRCAQLLSQSMIKKWRESFEQILNESDDIIVPSEFVRKQLPGAVMARAQVKPFALVPQAPVKKIKLAFLGAQAAHKGYDIWKHLAQNALITRKFDLVQLGDADPLLPHVKNLPCSYKDSRENVAVKVLKENAVGYVLLWSQVPESYSFTVHEAIAAGAFVLTCPESGNIAKVIADSPKHGVIHQNEQELVSYLMNLKG